MSTGEHYHLCTTFEGYYFLKIWENKNLLNLARFRTTFEFDHEYLSNRSRYGQ